MGDWQWIKENKLNFVNLIGSVSSIVGFAILILSLVSNGNDRSPEVVVWQYIFFFMSINGISLAIIFTFFWITEGVNKEKSKTKNIFIIASKMFVGILLVGVGFDALISAIHWTWMFGFLLF